MTDTRVGSAPHPAAGWPERLQGIVDVVLASPCPMLVLWGPDLVRFYNDAFGRLIGAVDPAGPGGAAQASRPDTWPLTKPILDRIWAGETLSVEDTVPGAPSDLPARSRLTLTYAPIRNEADAVAGVLVTVSGPPQCSMVSPKVPTRAVDAHPAPARLPSTTIEEPTRAEATRLRPEPRLGAAFDALDDACRSTAFPLQDDCDRIRHVGSIAQDIRDAKRPTENQANSTAELQHNARNILAVLRSIVRRTAGTSATVEEFALELDGRINTFARVQAASFRSPAGIDLEQMLADELQVHVVREGQRVRIGGPSTRFQPKAAETIALAFHELTINAIKYGALATPRGRIRVRWWREGPGEQPVLALTWKESGVAMPQTPAQRRGFGTDLLVHKLAYEFKAGVEHVMEHDGLRYSVQVPLSDKVVTMCGPPKDHPRP